MNSTETEIIYLKCTTGDWIVISFYFVVSICFIWWGLATNFSLGEWFACLATICALGVIGADDVFSKAGVQFIGDTFKLYYFPFWNRNEVSELIPVLEYDKYYSSMSGGSSKLQLHNGKFIPVTINSSRALQVHTILEERKALILARQIRELTSRSEQGK